MDRRTRWRRAATAAVVVVAVALAACGDDGDGGGSDGTTASTVPGALPATPIEVSVPTPTGDPLQGVYYPGASPDSPLVVLMHWELADRSDWYVVAPWLQNRGELNTFPVVQATPLTDPSWFPEMPEGESYAVLAVSMAGCDPYPSGCPEWLADQWFADTKAIMAFAPTLDGINPTRIVAVGSGVGADAAVDTCLWSVADQGASCKGAFAVSPGSYLGITFSEAVADLARQTPPVPVWCLAATPYELGLCDGADTEEAKAAGSQAIYVQNGTHANGMFVAEADPDPLAVLLDFLQTTVG